MRTTNLPLSIRRLVQLRAKGYCEYCFCHKDFTTTPFCIEHTLPKAFGGTDDESNLAYACGGCNGHKHTKIKATDPVTNALTDIFNPRQQEWQDHFVWNDTFTLIIGISDVGRTTIEALKLNRFPVVNVRKGMIAMGMHPPEHHKNVD
jgi:HNH endonuclease